MIHVKILNDENLIGWLMCGKKYENSLLYDTLDIINANHCKDEIDMLFFRLICFYEVNEILATVFNEI